jgi:hypothetical protein
MSISAWAMTTRSFVHIAQRNSYTALTLNGMKPSRRATSLRMRAPEAVEAALRVAHDELEFTIKPG